MLSKLIPFVKKHQADMILVVGVILISLLSFAMGYIVAKTYDKTPLKFEKNGYFSPTALEKFPKEDFRLSALAVSLFRVVFYRKALA